MPSFLIIYTTARHRPHSVFCHSSHRVPSSQHLVTLASLAGHAHSPPSSTPGGWHAAPPASSSGCAGARGEAPGPNARHLPYPLPCQYAHRVPSAQHTSFSHSGLAHSSPAIASPWHPSEGPGEDCSSSVGRGEGSPTSGTPTAGCSGSFRHLPYPLSSQRTHRKPTAQHLWVSITSGGHAHSAPSCWGLPSQSSSAPGPVSGSAIGGGRPCSHHPSLRCLRPPSRG